MSEQNHTLEDEIDEWLDSYGFQVPYNGTNNFYNDEKIKHARAGIDFIKPKLLQQVAELTKENDRVTHYLKVAEELNQLRANEIKALTEQVEKLRRDKQGFLNHLRNRIDRYSGFSGRNEELTFLESLLSKFEEHNQS